MGIMRLVSSIPSLSKLKNASLQYKPDPQTDTSLHTPKYSSLVMLVTCSRLFWLRYGLLVSSPCIWRLYHSTTRMSPKSSPKSCIASAVSKDTGSYFGATVILLMRDDRGVADGGRGAVADCCDCDEADAVDFFVSFNVSFFGVGVGCSLEELAFGGGCAVDGLLFFGSSVFEVSPFSLDDEAGRAAFSAACRPDLRVVVRQ